MDHYVIKVKRVEMGIIEKNHFSGKAGFLGIHWEQKLEVETWECVGAATQHITAALEEIWPSKIGKIEKSKKI